jgi:predicted 3-demethylubiquinone-9 3-methyltransferase (glyoxalase superfamily)
LEGQDFSAINGGPYFTFSPAISFVVDCKTQAEVDWYWDKLSESGELEQCGWLKDQFGVTWQIVPSVLGELMSDPDPVKAKRVTEAMLKMVKLDIAALQQAHDQA